MFKVAGKVVVIGEHEIVEALANFIISETQNEGKPSCYYCETISLPTGKNSILCHRHNAQTVYAIGDTDTIRAFCDEDDDWAYVNHWTSDAEFVEALITEASSPFWHTRKRNIRMVGYR